MSITTSQSAVKDFVIQKNLALVGVSRNAKKFGNLAYRSLTSKGYRVFPVHRSLNQYEGVQCYTSLQALPEKVDGVVIVVPPKETERVVEDASAAGIKRVWMQQGSESEASIQFCKEHGMSEVHGECILMFTEPVRSIHWIHRCINRFLHTLPQQP